MNFTFHTPTQIHFGCNKFNETGKLVKHFGKKCLIVTGRNSMKNHGYLDKIKIILKKESIEPIFFNNISNDAKSSEVNKGALICREENIDFIIALGGGSAIDGAKAISVCYDLENIEPLIGVQLKKDKKSLPLVAIPTTAGTGSEVTKGAIITDDKKNYKSGVRGEQIFPKIAIIDPILSITMPEDVAATTGFDTFTHLFESYIANKSNNFTDMISIAGLKLIMTALPKSLKSPTDIKLREKISYAALLGGINVGNASTCIPHRLQQAMGSVPSVHQAHAKGLAAIYPSWTTRVYNFRKEKIEKLKDNLDQKGKSTDFIDEFIENVGVKNKLSEYNVKKDHIDIFVKNISGNLDNDPIEPKSDKLFKEIYLESL
jgi:alcohol dehydrogenase class IV